MPSATKYHLFKDKTFQGLAYCDYCGKLLWGLGRQGVQCTDSEAESLSKFTTSPRASLDLPRLEDRPKRSEDMNSSRTYTNDHPYFKSKTTPPVKAYRKSFKQHVQNTILATASMASAIESPPTSDAVLSPHTTAKAFSRLVARSRGLFYITTTCYDIYAWRYPPLSILCVAGWIVQCLYPLSAVLIPPLFTVLLYRYAGTRDVPASQVLLPRYDEASPEYYANLERTQQTMLFLIRLYDNLVFHLQHLSLRPLAYKALFVVSTALSVLLYYAGRWIILGLGLVLLLNKTWVGTSIEAMALFVLELAQTGMEVVQRIVLRQGYSEKKPVEISVYENQRWWAGSGYTSQLLRSERTAWSNITGSEPLPLIDDMPPPPNYMWEDDHWRLDVTGPWIDDLLGIVMDGCIQIIGGKIPKIGQKQ
ncbi:hypothetical protein DFQ28_000854 [Apophysomyces sp. BC1034]|nr:hypothetical protein DFQ30_006915 [Apophysomyces sp. BC1015]KAG0181097.1 hypothetical protein DFQ29_009328 [Apophysomyces sp. BC1021]KAG0191151.1 hypothetical protein DFQ28_000854 [Apophysomyces sp. BC1034]